MSYLFITYTQVDQVYAQKLSEFLIQQGFNIWMYAQPGGSDALKEVIDKGIRESGAYLPLLSPAAQVAPHVMRELGMANQYGRPLFPLLLSGGGWRLLGSIQVEDVRQGQLPPQAFLDRLAEHITRTPGQARNLTSAEAQQPAPMPAPHDSPEMTSLSRPAGLRQLSEVYRATLITAEEDTSPAKKAAETPAPAPAEPAQSETPAAKASPAETSAEKTAPSKKLVEKAAEALATIPSEPAKTEAPAPEAHPSEASAEKTTPSKKQLEKAAEPPVTTATAPFAADDAEPGLTAITRPQGFDQLAELYRASLSTPRGDKNKEAPKDTSSGDK